MKRGLLKTVQSIVLLVMLCICSTINAQSFKVVGYMINWGNGPALINTLDYSKFTHINYCFQNPDASGNLTSSNVGLSTLVTNAHAANVKVLVSLGGAGTSYDATLRGIWLNLITPGNRTAFIQKISNYVAANNLDGVDVDIEGDGINGDYDGFVIALCNSLQPQGKLVTAAIKSDYGNPALVNTSLAKMDFMNVMAYDKTGNWDPTPGQHSSYSYATGMIDYWIGRGVPASKLTLGLPFYGYGWNGDAGSWSYAQIIAKYPSATNADQAGNIIYYNGIQTIKDKTTYACTKGLGGVMIWELTNDVTGSNSLLQAIMDSKGACGAVPTVSITSPANNAGFTANSNITINANASTTSGSITKVDFYNGSTFLGSDNSAPYSFTWNNVAAGTYTVKAVATNSSNATATASITVHVTGPFGGTPWPIPGKVEAENYNLGGQGFAYNDVTAGNSGGAYRTEDVDIEPMGTGGYDVGYTAAGEWMKYAVNVTASGVYNFQFNIATTDVGKSFHIEMDGSNVTGAVNLPNTGAWGTYQVVTVNNVSLTSGIHEMKIVMDTDGFNIDYINVVALPAPTVTFNNVTKTYGDAVFNVAAASNSTAAITYSITSGSAFATITPSGQVTIKGAGTVTLQASQAAGGGYNSKVVTATLTINKANLIAIADNKTKVYNTVNPPLTISYSGFVYGETAAVLTPAPGASTAAVTTSNVGAYPITLSGGASANYNITSNPGTLNVTPATPTLSYTAATTGNQGSTINLTATSNSTGAISYSVANGTGTATLAGSTLSLTSVGNVVVTISVAATGNYLATSITQSISITSLGNPTFTFNNVSKTYGDAAFNVTATSNSPGAITYSITAGAAFASITSGGLVTITGAGTVTLQASQAAAGGYNAGTTTATLTIGKANLTATAVNKTKVYNTANPALTISYSGFVYGETVSVLSAAPTASTTAITGSNVGTYPITLTGGTAANYNLTLNAGTLTVTKATPTLSYTGAVTGNQGGTISLTATSNSTGAISYAVANGTGTATLTGTTLSLTSIGNVVVTVNLAASTNYTATSITQTISITSLGSPSITFNNITKTYGDAAFNVTATSNSPGAISYVITAGSAYAIITPDGLVTIKGAGTVTIQASQVAAGGYNAGTTTATLTINKANLIATADNKTKVYNTANPALTISYSGFVYGETASFLSAEPTASTTAFTYSDAGVYPISLVGGIAENYALILNDGTLTVTQASPNIAFNNLTATYGDAAFTVAATSNAPGAITYTIISGSSFATITPNGLVTIIGAGSVVISANQAASTSYAASSATATLTINKAATTLVYTGPTSGFTTNVLTLSVNSSSWGVVSYEVLSGGTGSATVSFNQLQLIGAGVVTIQITVASDDNHLAQILNQDITITNIATGVTGGTSTDNTQLTVMPNPCIDHTTIQLNMAASTKGSIYLCDLTGKVLYQIAEGTIEKDASYDVPMNQFSDGMYLVTVVTENGRMVKKISK